MGDAAFQGLSAEDKRRVLRIAQTQSGHGAYLLEKDVGVVQTLSVLFDAPTLRQGSTSLALKTSS